MACVVAHATPTPERGASNLDADGADEAAVSPLTLKARLPGGLIGTSLMRMRDTTNGYLDKLAVPEWKDSFKLTSVKALVKRMTDIEPKVQHTKQMQLITAYRLLKKRLDATVAIRKECGRYLEDGTHAANALDHLNSSAQSHPINLSCVFQCCRVFGFWVPRGR